MKENEEAAMPWSEHGEKMVDAYVKASRIRPDEWRLYCKCMPEQAGEIIGDIGEIGHDRENADLIIGNIVSCVRSFQREASRKLPYSRVPKKQRSIIMNKYPMSEWDMRLCEYENKIRRSRLDSVPEFSLLNDVVVNSMANGDMLVEKGIELHNHGYDDVHFTGRLGFDGAVLLSGIYAYIRDGRTEFSFGQLAMCITGKHWSRISVADRKRLWMALVGLMNSIDGMRFRYGMRIGGVWHNMSYTGRQFVCDLELGRVEKKMDFLNAMRTRSIRVRPNTAGNPYDVTDTRPVLMATVKSKALPIEEKYIVSSSHLDIIGKLYVAKRVKLSFDDKDFNESGGMRPAIVYGTFSANDGCDDETSARLLKLYFNDLQDIGAISWYAPISDRIKWGWETDKEHIDNRMQRLQKCDIGGYYDEENQDVVDAREEERRAYEEKRLEEERRSERILRETKKRLKEEGKVWKNLTAEEREVEIERQRSIIESCEKKENIEKEDPFKDDDLLGLNLLDLGNSSSASSETKTPFDDAGESDPFDKEVETIPHRKSFLELMRRDKK